MTGPASYLLERAWVDGAVRDDVLVTIEDGRFTSVVGGGFETVAARPPQPAARLAGLTIPGLANGHSHAFHRALRGRTQRERGTFWTWREQMYAVAARLDPDSYLATGAGDVPRDGRGRLHERGGVPLRAPPAGRDAVRRRRSDARGAGAGRRRGRHPDDVAGHLLPQQRLREAARGRATTFQRRHGRAVGTTCTSRSGGHPLVRARCRATSSTCSGAGAPARAPLEQLARERGVPGGVRRDPDPAPPRGGTARSGHDGRARHPPVRRRRRPAGRDAHQRLHHAHHRARPGRRDRPGPQALRGRLPHQHRERQPRGHRRVRGAARPRDGRAAGHAAARPLDRRRAARHRLRARPDRDRRGGAHRGGRPCGPRDDRHPQPAHRGHRGRRAHRGLRGHRRRRDPRGRGRRGGLHERGRRGDRARARHGDRRTVEA